MKNIKTIILFMLILFSTVVMAKPHIMPFGANIIRNFTFENDNDVNDWEEWDCASSIGSGNLSQEQVYSGLYSMKMSVTGSNPTGIYHTFMNGTQHGCVQVHAYIPTGTDYTQALYFIDEDSDGSTSPDIAPTGIGARYDDNNNLTLRHDGTQEPSYTLPKIYKDNWQKWTFCLNESKYYFFVDDVFLDSFVYSTYRVNFTTKTLLAMQGGGSTDWYADDLVGWKLEEIDFIIPGISMISPNIEQTSVFSDVLNWNLSCTDNTLIDNTSITVFRSEHLQISNDLLRRYNFEEGSGLIAYDSSMYGINASHNADYDSNTPNDLYSLNFSGAEYVNTSLDLSGLEKLSISVWFYRSSNTERLDISQSDNTNVDRIKLIRNNNGKIYVIVGSGIGTYTDNSVGWIHLTVVYDGTGLTNSDKLKLYVNGVQVTLNFSGTVPSTIPSIPENFLKIGRDDGSDFYGIGNIDNFQVLNVSLSNIGVSDIYHGISTYYRDVITNINSDTFSYTNETELSGYESGIYNVSFECIDTTGNINLSQSSFLIDQILPTSIYTFPTLNEEIEINTTFNFNWTFSDNNLLWSLNISCNNSEFGIVNIGASEYNYDEEVLFNVSGTQNCTINYCDSHTKLSIDDYEIYKDYEHDSLIINNITIRSFNSKINDISYTKKLDRYEFCFTPSSYKEQMIFSLSKNCVPVTNSKYKAHYVCDNKYWLDFEGHDVYSIYNNIYVDTRQYSEVKKPEPICFNSIGSLNCVDETMSFNIVYPEIPRVTGLDNFNLDEQKNILFLFVMVILYLGVMFIGLQFRNFGFVSLGFFIGVFIGLMFMSFHPVMSLVMLFINISIAYTASKKTR